MSRIMFFLVVVMAATLALPAASAFNLTVEGLADPPAAIGENETRELSLTITMTQEEDQNLICAQPGTITVVLTAVGADEGLALGAEVDPSEVDLTISTNAYLGASGQPWSDSETATLILTVGDQLPFDHNAHTYGVDAVYDGTAPENCQGDFKSADDKPRLSVPLVPPTNPDNETNGNGGGGGDDDAEEGPAPGLTFALGALGLAALMRRRRA